LSLEIGVRDVPCGFRRLHRRWQLQNDKTLVEKAAGKAQ
jgi:hypothetical protein